MIREAQHSPIYVAILLLCSASVAVPAAVCAAGAQPGGDRVALVVGNSAYGGLENVSGAQDAKGMYDYLQQMHFTVLTPVYDGDLVAMQKGLLALQNSIATASTVIFFYSGHGFQLGQENYLQPIGATPTATESLALDDVLRSLSHAPQDAVKLVFLDACRTILDPPSNTVLGLGQLPPNLPTRPEHTLIGYATQYGFLSASGSVDGRSPYSDALLVSIREPGLEIGDLMKRVHQDVANHTDGQSPVEDGLDEIPAGFYLQAPVFVQPEVQCFDDDLIVLLNGKVVLNASDTGKPSPLRLRAGDNSLELLVYNQKSYKNNNGLDRPEGWKYWLKLIGPDGKEVPCPEAPPGVPCLAAAEDVPLKDGPHHGKLFRAATATLRLDPTGTAVQLVDRKVDLWQTDAPLEARDQAVLYSVPVPLPFVKREIRVRGNQVAAGAVSACMQESGGIAALGSVLGALNDPAPLAPFTKKLSDCVSAKLGAQIRVSVTVENPAEDSPAVPLNKICG
jgi:hypothetical protein